MGSVTAKNRARVEARDGGCVARGQLYGRCWGHLDIGHLVGRGMGGTPEGSEFDSPAWTVLMCRYHNRIIEDRADQAKLATDLGLHYPRNFLRPSRAVVRYPDGVWYTLNADGTREPYVVAWAEEEAALDAEPAADPDQPSLI